MGLFFAKDKKMNYALIPQVSDSSLSAPDSVTHAGRESLLLSTSTISDLHSISFGETPEFS